MGLAVVNGQLYAVGGFDGTAYLKTIEVYDPETNQWRLCGCMNYRRLGGGVGVMRAPQTENYMWYTHEYNSLFFTKIVIFTNYFLIAGYERIQLSKDKNAKTVVQF